MNLSNLDGKESQYKIQELLLNRIENLKWFQFPRVYLNIDPVKDIVDWLIEDTKYAVKSLAAGSDWLSNIFYTGEYVEELPKISPDVFLISGGGNDLVGNNRLSIMVINPFMEKVRTKRSDEVFKELIEKRALDKDIDRKNMNED